MKHQKLMSGILSQNIRQHNFETDKGLIFDYVLFYFPYKGNETLIVWQEKKKQPAKDIEKK